MKIIRVGRKIEPKVYHAECRECGALTEFDDTELGIDGRYTDTPGMICPCCERGYIIGKLADPEKIVHKW